MSVNSSNSNSANMLQKYEDIEKTNIEIEQEAKKPEKVNSSLFEKSDQETTRSVKSLRGRVTKNEEQGLHLEKEIKRKRPRLEMNDAESLKKVKFSDDESLNKSEGEMYVVESTETKNLLSDREELKNKTYTWPIGNQQILFKYEGPYTDNKRDGDGTLISPEGYEYKGEFKNDEITGKGKFTGIQGKYEGDFVDGKMHGQGTFISAEGSYTGDFADNKKHGKGILKTKTLSYEGDFYNGKKHGQGTLVGADGAIYTGGFADNMRHGKGILKAKTFSYEGDFYNGKKHGQGTLVEGGGSYTGDFADDKFHGKGTAVYPNGDKYTGDFVAHQRQGKGTIVYANGDTYTGDFVAHQRQGKGTFVYANGDTYYGEVVFGEKQGQGTYIWSNGDKFVGQFPAANLIMRVNRLSNLERQSAQHRQQQMEMMNQSMPEG